MAEERDPLYENALDYLRHGVGLYVDEGEWETKHSILHIFRSIELLLKESLRRHDEKLIYRHPDRPITEDTPTIGLWESLKRLGDLGVTASDDERRVLGNLKSFRNRIEHHSYKPDKAHRPLVAKALKVVYNFMPLLLRETLEEALQDPELFRVIRDVILEYEERVAEAVAEIEWDTWKNKQAPPLATCPECGNETVMAAAVRGHFCYCCHKAVELEACERCMCFFNPTEMWADGICEPCHWYIQERIDRD